MSCRPPFVYPCNDNFGDKLVFFLLVKNNEKRKKKRDDKNSIREKIIKKLSLNCCINTASPIVYMYTPCD